MGVDFYDDDDDDGGFLQQAVYASGILASIQWEQTYFFLLVEELS